MIRARIALAGAALVVSAAGGAKADDSVFGIRGLGLLGRPISGRSAAAGGGFTLFDAASAMNPASLARWRAPAGWAVGLPTRRSVEAGGGRTTLGSTRFPLFGFATPVGQSLVIGVSVSDYLDRTWSVQTDTTLTLRDSAVVASDVSRSVGGVSDLRLAASYRFSPRFVAGLGFHALSGSTRLSVERTFSSEAYTAYRELAITDFTGFGVSAGAIYVARENLSVGASVRVQSRLKASSSGGQIAKVAMPLEMSLGVQYTPVPGVTVATTTTYQTWGRAADDLEAVGQERSRDVWGVGAGLELANVSIGARPLPLRIGYRWRQLPFPVTGEALSESAFTAGLEWAFAGGRGTVDAGVERGSRSTAQVKEVFTSAIIGITVRP